MRIHPSPLPSKWSNLFSVWGLKIFMLATDQKVEKLDFFPTAHTDVLSKDASLLLPGTLG